MSACTPSGGLDAVEIERDVVHSISAAPDVLRDLAMPDVDDRFIVRAMIVGDDGMMSLPSLRSPS